MNQVPSKISTEDRSKASAVSLSSSGNSSFLKVESLGDVVRFAEMMCQSKAGIPSYLHGEAADCMAITMQALQWGMNPFSVAQKSYKIKDVIAYEAQLIVAVINTRSGIEGRLEYDFEGEGQERLCIARGNLDGKILEVRSPKLKDIHPKNSPLWKSDPDQQHCYYTGRSWGRRHTPEVILGVYDREEAAQFGPDNARDVTPKPSVMQRMQASASAAPQEPAGEREGFTASSVQQQTSRVLDGDIVDDEPHDAETGKLIEQPASDAPAPGASDDGSAEPSAEATVTEPADDPASSAGSLIPEKDLVVLRRFARDALAMAANPQTSGDTMSKTLRRWFNMDLTNLSEAGLEAAKGIKRSVEAIMSGKASYDAAIEFHAEGLGVEPAELMLEVGNG